MKKIKPTAIIHDSTQTLPDKKRKEVIPDSFYEPSIILILIPDKAITRKETKQYGNRHKILDKT